MRNGVVVMIVCVHVDGITVAVESEAWDFLSTCLLEGFPDYGRGTLVVPKVRV